MEHVSSRARYACALRRATTAPRVLELLAQGSALRYLLAWKRDARHENGTRYHVATALETPRTTISIVVTYLAKRRRFYIALRCLSSRNGRLHWKRAHMLSPCHNVFFFSASENFFSRLLLIIGS